MPSFFSLSKIFWFFAAPDHLMVFMLIFALFCLWVGWRRLGGSLLAINLLLWLALIFMPLGDLLLRPLESRFAQPDLSQLEIEGVIVLGGGELAEESALWQQPQFNAAAERVMVIPVLARQFPNAKILFTGGSGSALRPEFKGAEVIATYVEQLGLENRVILESDSRNTHENALFSAKLLGGVPQGNWLLVTSAFHMPRSVGIFRHQGWNLTPYPVDYYSVTANGLRNDPKLWQNLRDLHTAVREWIGLVVYFYTDKTDELLPGPAHG